MRKLGILVGCALALSACETTPPPPPDLNNALLAPGFLAQASSANQFEIQSSQLALQASQNAQVRNLANVIIADHTQLGQRLPQSPLQRTWPAAVGNAARRSSRAGSLHSAGTGYSFDQAINKRRSALTRMASG
jgi:putative membrane protein